MKNIIAGVSGISLIEIMPNQSTIDTILSVLIGIATLFFQWRNNRKFKAK